MSDLLLYFLKANLALVLFFLAYHFAFKRLTFYTVNRFFLLFALVFSAVCPLVDLSPLLSSPKVFSAPVIQIVQSVSITDELPLVRQNAPDISTYNYWSIADLVLWAGMCLMGARLLIRLFSLYRIYRRSSPMYINGLVMRRVEGEVNPFSFWKSVYLNPSVHAAHELPGILAHEQVHVQQLHTLDVIIAELGTVMYWFNPASWLLKIAVKENLEFITDQQLVETGTDVKQYQYSLIRISNLPQHSALVNNFNFLTIKKRIAMMNQQRSSRKQISRYILLVPVLIAASFIFTVSKAQTESSGIFDAVNDALPAMLKSPVSGLKTPSASKPAENTAGNQIRNDQNIDANSVTHDGVTAQSSAAVQQNLPVSVQDTSRKKLNLDSVLFFIDSKAVSQEMFKEINPANIKSVSILKDANSLKRYGPAARNGVILVETKEASPATTEKSGNATVFMNRENGGIFPNENTLQMPKSLVIIDGRESSWKEVNEMPKDEIAAFTVMKAPAAMALYQNKGANGVVLIQTKKGIATKKAKADSIGKERVQPVRQ